MIPGQKLKNDGTMSFSFIYKVKLISEKNVLIDISGKITGEAEIWWLRVTSI